MESHCIAGYLSLLDPPQARLWRFILLQSPEGFFEPLDSLGFSLQCVDPEVIHAAAPVERKGCLVRRVDKKPRPPPAQFDALLQFLRVAACPSILTHLLTGVCAPPFPTRHQKFLHHFHKASHNAGNEHGDEVDELLHHHIASADAERVRCAPARAGSYA